MQSTVELVLRRLARASAIALTALLVASCGGDDETSSNVQSMAVFGDSLSDLGTYEVPAVAASGGGRFTTGANTKLWVEYLADYYGVGISRNRTGGFGSAITVLGGTGYAEGGSRVALQPGINCVPDGMGGCTLQGALTRPITQQVAAHLAANGGRIPGTQLIVILGGANDIIYQAGVVQAAGGTPASVAAAQAALVTAGGTLAATAKSLVSAGATKVLVLTVPDLGYTIQGQSSTQARDLLSGLTLAFNSALTGSLAGAANIVVLPTADFFFDALAHPAQFGFVNVTQPACNIAVLPGNSSLFCSSATLVAPNAQSNFLFADTIHPTAGGHQQFANYVLTRLPASFPR